MNSKFAMGFILFFTLFITAGQAWAVTVSYNQKVSVGENTVATIKVLVKDDLMRAESDFNGMISMLYRNKKGTFTYLPAQKMAAQMPPSLDRPNITRDIPKYMEFLNSNGAKKTGSETINGVECDVYTFLEPNISREGKAWMWKEKSFPVKIEVDAPEGKTKIEMTDINFAPVAQDSDFDLPADAKIFNPMATPPATREVPQPQDAAAAIKEAAAKKNG